MNIDIVILVGFPFYILALLVQDKIAHAMYVESWDAWNKVGAPGGWFWCPNRRSWLDNLMKTQRFWFENMFGLENESLFSERVRRLYKLYYSIVISVLFLFIGFVFTLVYLGLSKSEN